MSPGCLAGGYPGKPITQVNLGSSPDVHTASLLMSMCFDNRKSGPPQLLDVVPLLSDTIWQVLTHAARGPAARPRHVASLEDLGTGSVESTPPKRMLNGAPDAGPIQPEGFDRRC
jgi:hypothetical protein